MNEWNIQSRARNCQVCEKGFADKEHYHTLLLTNKHELARMDVCIPCWESKYAGQEEDRKGFISHWQGIYHASVATAATEPIQKESAETLLRKLIEANDPKHGPACYILAVMLERKRQLKIKEQIKRDGVRIFVYEHPGSGDLFTITDPNLQLNQLEAVQRDVADLLVHGLPAAPEPAPAPVPAPSTDDQAPSQPDSANAPAVETPATTAAPASTDAPAANVPASADAPASPEAAPASPTPEVSEPPASNNDSQPTTSACV